MRVLLAIVCVAVLGLPVAAGAHEPVPFRLQLEPVGGRAKPPAGTITLTDPAGIAEPRRLAVSADGVEATALLPGSRWHLRAEVPGWWMPEELLLVEGANATRRIWRAAPVSGTLTLVDARERLPERVMIAIEETPVSRGGTLPKKASVDCPVARDGRFACDVPAGTADLSFRAGRFIPHYRWGVRLEPGFANPVGTLALRRGASLAGWAAAGDGKTRLTKATARLTRPVAFGADGQLAERLARPAAVADVLPSGFFQLTGVEPGAYELVVSHPGFADARLHPVEVQPDAETTVRSLIELRPPTDFRLRIEPPTDAGGADWHVEVDRLSDFGGSMGATRAFDGRSTGGEVRVSGQSPGRFAVRVTNGSGDPWADPDIVVTENETEPHVIRLSVIRVAGELLRGTKPVATELWFGGRRGAVHVKAVSDEEGKFDVTLPRDGRWLVEVATAAGTTELQADVRVDEDGNGELVLRLPDNRVEGIVVAADGKPERADVILSTATTMLTARSAADGTFSFESVPAGAARLRARGTGDRQSNVELLEIAGDGAAIGPVRLQLLTTKTLEGRVVYLGRPVPGAVLMVRPPGHAQLTATTDLQGRFSVNLPAGVPSVGVTVLPPGYALRTFEVAADDAVAELNVSPDGGTLRLLFPVPSNPSAPPPQLFQNGRPLPVVDLLRWAQSQNALASAQDRLDVPNAAPGTYRVCGADGTCRETQLAPGGVAEIEMTR